MPSIVVSKKVMDELIGKKLSEDEFKDRLSYLGTDLEKIEGDEVHVEIFPNRPDMLSEQGLARAMSSFIGVKCGLREYKVKKSDYLLKVEKSVKDVRPYAACAVVKGLRLDNEKIIEIMQLQEKLHVTYGRKREKAAIGVYPLERIKFPIVYKAADPRSVKFVPLEADKEMDGLQILSKHPKGRDYAHLLEGKKLFPYFIDANDKVLSMPPIINSHDVGKIMESTEDVFVECTGFDLGVLKTCLNIIVTTLADMGGSVYSMDMKYEHGEVVTPDLNPSKMRLSLNYVNKRLGLQLKEDELKELLERMGYGYQNGGIVLVPAYRADILHQIDFVEDIAIAYGYENFEPLEMDAPTVASEDKFEKFKRKVVYLLVGLGLQELNTYHIMSKNDLLNNMCSDYSGVELANSLSEEYNVLRNWMVPSLMCVLRANKMNEYPQKIFDIGRVFKKNTKMETSVEEFERLGVLLCSKSSDLTEARKVLDYLFRMLNINYGVVDTEHPSFIKGRVGRVEVDYKGELIKVAYIGEINPQVLNNFGIEMPTSGFELNLTELYNIL